MTLRSSAIGALRKITGKKDVRSFVRLRRLSLEKLLYRRKYTLSDLRHALRGLGIAAGRTVWVQSSWNEFYNLDEKPSAVIDCLLELVGPTGTLAMPANPLDFNPDKVFVAERAPVSTGLICELFRRRPGVKRSIHLASSVVAWGPNAEFLTSDHHLTETPFDRDSPFQRLMDVDALCVGMGVGRPLASLTPLHSVEAILRHEDPFFAGIFHDTTTYRWASPDGERNGEHTFLHRHGAFNAGQLARYYPKQMFRKRRLSNLWLWSISARDAINTGVELGRRGVTMYKS